MNKKITTILMLLIAVFSINTVSAEQTEEKVTVEITPFMNAYLTFAYYEQIYEQEPTNREAFYRLNILASTFSTNGNYDGLNAGMETRRLAENTGMPNYHNIVFVER